MLSQPDSIKDRNGEDVQVGDMVFYLRGSMAGDNYYETCDEIEGINPRTRVVRTHGGDHLFWHEIWKEPL